MPSNGAPNESGLEPARPGLLALLVFLAAALLLCWPMLSGQFIGGPASDQYVAGYGFRHFAAEYWKTHHSVPLWNPYIFGGMPFVGGMHGDIFYPTAWLRWILPTGTAMNLGFALHLVIAGVAMYALLREFRTGWAAAVTGGVAYQLTGLVASLVSPGHDGKLFVSALAPLLFLALLRGVRHRKLAGFGATALLIGLALHGHPQMTYYLLIAAAIWAVYLVFWDEAGPRGGARWRIIGLGVLAVALGMAIYAVQAMPFAAYIPFSPRAEGGPSSGWEYATGFAFPPSSSMGVSAKHFAEKVAELSDGKVKVETFPDGTLFGGDQNAAVNLLGNGTLDSTIMSTSVYASFEPRMNAISLPYLFKDTEEVTKYFEGEPGKELLGSLDKLGIKGVSMLTRTPRHTTNSVRPITQPEDFKDLKLRVPQNDLWVKFFGSLGANPTPMDFKEVYTALQLGTIDGQENPLEVPVNNKFFEVQDYLSLTGHISDGLVLGFSKKKWDSFDEDTRKVLQEAADETADFKTKHDNDEATKILDKLKSEGVKINELTPEAREKFQAAAQKVYPELEGKVGKEFVQSSLEFLGR